MATKNIMNSKQMNSALEGIAKQIVKRNRAMAEVALIGIRSRGVPIAETLAKKISAIIKKDVPVGSLDINLYRDDLSEVDEQPIVRKSELPFSVGGKGVVLVDDVLYTGRTIRSALDALTDFGRPKFVQLAVMIDRGWRELPIQADFVGKALKTGPDEVVHVMIRDIDGTDQVIVKK